MSDELEQTVEELEKLGAPDLMVSPRDRDGREYEMMPLGEFIRQLKHKIETRSNDLKLDWPLKGKK